MIQTSSSSLLQIEITTVIIIQDGIEIDNIDLKTINQSAAQIIENCKETYQDRLVLSDSGSERFTIFEEYTKCVKKGVTQKQSYEKIVDDGKCGVASMCLQAKDISNHPERNYLLLLMNAGWAIAYGIYIVGNQVQRKYCAIPYAALIMNIMWEFLFSYIWTHKMSKQQIYAHIVWFWLDALLAIQYVWFESKQIRKAPLWYLLLTVTLAVSVICFVYELNDYGGIYSAYVQNLVMSLLFVREVLVSVPSSKVNQDPWVTWIAGIFRLIGTAAMSLYLAEATCGPKEQPSLLLLFLYYAIFILDIVYVFVSYKLWKK